MQELSRKGPTMSLIQDQDIVLTIEPGLVCYPPWRRYVRVRLPISQSNLIVTIIGPAGEDSTKHITDILVASDACKKSPYLKALIGEEPSQNELTFGGENKEGTLVWLAHLHGLPEQRLRDLGLFEISLIGVWHAISLWSTHQDDKVKESLGDWFNTWYDTSMAKAGLTVPIAQALAYPCYMFDHAVGYARVTKYLAYENIGHIKERPPKGFKSSKQLRINEKMFTGE